MDPRTDAPPDSIRRPQIHWVAVAVCSLPFLILGALTALTDADDWVVELEQPFEAGRNRVELAWTSAELAERHGGLVGFLFGMDRAQAARASREVSADLVELATELDAWQREVRLLERLAERLAAAPEERRPVGELLGAEDTELLDDLEGTVLGDRALADLARERGDPERAAQLEAGLDQRVAAFARWASVLTGAMLLVLALGSAFAVELWLDPERTQLGSARIPPAFELRQALGVFFLGMLGGFPLGIVLLIDLDFEPPLLLPLFAWTALLAWALLCDPAHPPATSFGLDVPPRRAWRLAGWTLLLTGVSVVWDQLLWLARGWLPEVGWAEGFLEPVSLGSPLEVLVTGVDATLGAGTFEELAFRGILFAGLRRKLGFWAAALASTVVFVAVHGYGLLGVLSVGGFALAACWTYERSRSLLPCVLAHALSNGLLLAQELAFRAAVE